jgi:hypothetical protein
MAAKLELEVRIHSILDGLTAKLQQVLQDPVNLTGTDFFFHWVNRERTELGRLAQIFEQMSTVQLNMMAVFIELESRVFCRVKFDILDRLRSTFWYFYARDRHRIDKSFRKLVVMFDPMAERRPRTRRVLKEITALRKYLRKALPRMRRPYELQDLSIGFNDDDWPDESVLREAGFAN